MDDFLEITAVRQKKGIFSLLYYLIWAVMIAFGLFAALSISNFIRVNPETGSLNFNWISLLVAVITGAIAFVCFRQKDNCRVEYDYTFTNGTLDISKVLNDKRRRYLCSVETKDIVRCGPAAGPAFMKTLNEPDVKRHNWFVNREARLYFFYFIKKGVKHVMVLELTEPMIEVMRSKSNYIQRGAWYEADGSQKYGVS